MPETPQNNPDIMTPEEEAAWDNLEKRLELERKAKEKRGAIKVLKASGEETDEK